LVSLLVPGQWAMGNLPCITNKRKIKIREKKKEKKKSSIIYKSLNLLFDNKRKNRDHKGLLFVITIIYQFLIFSNL